MPGEPDRGYYNDLRPHLAAYVPDAARAAESIARLTADADAANPVTILQVGLGAWQAAQDDGRWRSCVESVAEWAAGRIDDDGVLPYRFPLRGTYTVEAPWCSAMAQGEAASFLVRAASLLERPELLAAARRAVRPLLDARPGIVVETEEGPVLEEYPTSPPSHVLNGWVFALWGLYDVAHSDSGDAESAALFARSTDTLAARLRLYELPGGWTRYDLYPHPLPNVASPFYHRLHVVQLRALAALYPSTRIVEAADRWERAARRPWVEGAAVAAKVAFRVVRPRRRR